MNESIQEVEKIVIGSISWDAHYSMPLCVAHDVGDKFDNPKYQQIYRLASALYLENKPIDLDILSLEYGKAYKTSIKADMLECEKSVISIHHLEYYLDILDLQYLQRKTKTNVDRTSEYLEKANPDDIKDTITKIQKSWIRFNQKESTGATEVSLYETGKNLLTEWKTPLDQEKLKIHWPYPRLDQSLGWLDNEFVILAGRPGCGKTSMALAMCLQQAYQGIPTAIASLESKQRFLVARLIAMIGNLSTLELKKKNLFSIDDAEAAVEKIKDLPLTISDNSMSLEQLAMWGHIQKEAGARLLVVDNMRHIKPSKKYSSTIEQFRDISLSVKFLRDDIDIPIILLHHLSRDLRLSWSDDIERDADIILFLLKDEECSEPATPENHWCGTDKLDLEIKKNREGNHGITDRMNFLLWKQVFLEA